MSARSAIAKGRRPRRAADRRARAEVTDRLGKTTVTVDLDSTLYDPWACCGRQDLSLLGSPACRHVRTDVLADVHQAIEATGASLAVLSWRSGLVTTSRKWLAAAGIEVDAVFIPGSADTTALLGDAICAPGQVGFKTAVATALGRSGVEVVAAYDDNAEVIEALRGLGVEGAAQVDHLVAVGSLDWSAGFLGATPADLRWPPSQSGLFDDSDYDSWAGWEELDDLDFVPGERIWFQTPAMAQPRGAVVVSQQGATVSLRHGRRRRRVPAKYCWWT
ncbi:MAG: hypothetical protein ACRD0J_15855 [Acidimicrobiales bacterium]